MAAMDDQLPTDGTRLLGTAFPDDDGTADPDVRAALAAVADGSASPAQALLVVQDARVLVPVVAVLGEVETGPDGLARDKSSDMAAVLVTGSRGGRALLAFTGTDALQAWNPDARPVPVSVRTAARAAAQEGAAALVLDLAGPAPLTVHGRDLEALATGWRMAHLDGRPSWVRSAPPEPGSPAPGTTDSPPPE